MASSVTSRMALANTLTIISVLSVVPLYAQKTDSLEAMLPHSSGGKRIDILFQLAYEHLDNDLTTSRTFSAKGYLIAREMEDSARMLTTGSILAYASFHSGLIDSALAVYTTLIPIARERRHPRLRKMLNTMALCYSYRAQYDRALHLHFESLELRQQAGDTAQIASVMNNIGLVYYKLKDYDKALVYYNHCLALKKKIHDRWDFELLLTNIGLCYANTDRLDRARYFGDLALNHCVDNCTANVRMHTEFLYGVIGFLKKNLPDAEGHFVRSYAFSKQTGDRRLQLDNLDYLSRICLNRDMPAKAAEYLARAESLIAPGTPYNLELMKIYSRLYEAYGQKKNFQKIALYQGKYIGLRDSLFNEELTSNLMRIESGYLEREHKARMAAAEQIRQLNEQVISRQNLVNIVTVGLTVLMILFAIVLVRVNRQRKMINRILDERIIARTRDLEANQSALMRKATQKEILMEKMAINIKGHLATIKGLCAVGLLELSEPDVRQYVSKVIDTTNALDKELGGLMSNAANNSSTTLESKR